MSDEPHLTIFDRVPRLGPAPRVNVANVMRHLQIVAEREATDAGIASPERWPWDPSTADGYEQWLTFVQPAVANGTAGEVLLEMRLREAAQAGKPPGQRSGSQPGPEPITTKAEVDRARKELNDEGRPSGERSIAGRLGVSRDAVRYASGKDRRRS